MPEFAMPVESDVGARTFVELPAFVHGYIEAMFFTSSGEPDDALPEDATWLDLAPVTLDSIKQDCARFQVAAGELLERAYACVYDVEQAGRDLWFTRNGHGVGFWDRPALEPREEWKALGSPRVGESGWNKWIAARADGLGERLSALCGHGTDFPPVDPYTGDDGRIYLS